MPKRKCCLQGVRLPSSPRAHGTWPTCGRRALATRSSLPLRGVPLPVQENTDRCQVTAHPDFGIGLNPDSDHPEAAKTFLAWLASAEFSQLLSDVMSGFSRCPSTLFTSRTRSDKMFDWTQTCGTSPRLNVEKLNRVWPTLEDEQWFVNVKVLDQRMAPAEAAARIQRLHEQNPHVPHPR